MNRRTYTVRLPGGQTEVLGEGDYIALKDPDTGEMFGVIRPHGDAIAIVDPVTDAVFLLIEEKLVTV